MGCSGERSISSITLNSISPDLIIYPKKDFIEDFICCICFNIPLDPKRCNKCLHIFCESCIRETKKCPYRCENFDLINIDRIINNILNKCIFRCPYFEQGLCQYEIKFDKIREHLEKHENNEIKNNLVSEYQIDKYSKYNKKTTFNSKQIEIATNYIKEQKSKMDNIKDKYTSTEFLMLFLDYKTVKLSLLFTEGIIPDNQNIVDDINKEKEYARKLIFNIKDKLWNKNLKWAISYLRDEIKLNSFSTLELTNEEKYALTSMIEEELKFVSISGIKRVLPNDFVDYFGKNAEKNIYLFRKSLEQKYFINI